jgi:plastocyanin
VTPTRLVVGPVAAIAIMVGLAACGGDSVETGKVAGKAGGTPTAHATSVAVDAHNFEFTPDTIRIEAHDEVALALHSDDGPHDFAVDGLGLVAEVGGGETDTQRLRIDAPGRYTFFCTLPGHRDGGMEGTIVVR